MRQPCPASSDRYSRAPSRGCSWWNGWPLKPREHEVRFLPSGPCLGMVGRTALTRQPRVRLSSQALNKKLVRVVIVGMKLCLKCETSKPFCEFNKRRNGFQPHCRSCQADWYQANKERHIANVARRRKRVRKEIDQNLRTYLQDHPCVDCGEADPVVLEFDHVRGEKLECVSLMRRSGYEWTTILTEIAKCEVRCANCHRRVTSRRAGNWSKSW